MIKIVQNHRGYGKLYLPKAFRGRVIRIILLKEEEEKKYLDELCELEKTKKEALKRTKLHLDKLRKLREANRILNKKLKKEKKR